VHSSLF